MGRKLKLCYKHANSQRRREHVTRRASEHSRSRGLHLSSPRLNTRLSTTVAAGNSAHGNSVQQTISSSEALPNGGDQTTTGKGDNDESSGGENEDYSSSSDDSESPLKLHPALTKATRKSKKARIVDKAEADDENDPRKVFLEALYEMGNISTRQTFALKTENWKLALECGVFKKIDWGKIDSNQIAVGFAYCVMGVISWINSLVGPVFNQLSVLTEVGKPVAPAIQKKKLLCQITGIGEQHAQRMLQLANKKDHQFVPGPALLNKSGPKLKDGSGRFTRHHLRVLSASLNYFTRFNVDQTTEHLAVEMQKLPPSGEPIHFLLNYLDGEMCFLKEVHRGDLREACANSPGPIFVSAQEVLRAIHKISSLDSYYDEFHFGDRTKVKSTGASATGSEEGKRKAKIAYVAEIYSNKTLKRFVPEQHQPRPDFVMIPSKYRLPEFQCRYKSVFMDESWVSVGMRPNLTWISRNGEQQEIGNDKGVRFVMILFADASGVHSWRPEDYQNKRDFYVRSVANHADALKNKVFIKALESAKGFPPSAVILERHLTKEHEEFEKQSKTFFGFGGVYAWQIKPDSKAKDSGADIESAGTSEQHDKSYKSNVTSESIVNIFKFQAHFADCPLCFVIDNASYHKKRDGYTPYKLNVTLKESVAFLKEQPPESDLGKLWTQVKTTKSNGEETSKLKRADLIVELQKIVPETLADLEFVLAEIGIRKFGVPHRVLFLPVRMPEFNPIEFIWAWVKFFYKHNRDPRLDKQGNAAGTMGIETARTLLAGTLCAIPQTLVGKCFRHVENTVKDFYTSTIEIEEAIDEIVQEKLERARAFNTAGTPTRSNSKPSQNEIPPFERNRQLQATQTPHQLTSSSAAATSSAIATPVHVMETRGSAAKPRKLDLASAMTDTPLKTGHKCS